jgi:glycosyltransferase involved in cell wall biosynthesis
VLIVDQTFPVAMGAWRLSETHTLMWHCDADVLVVKRLEHYAGAFFPLDHEAVYDSHGLHRYAAHVFDPAYNDRLAGLNARAMGAAFNGSAWNGALRASYLLRRREHAHEPVNLTSYEAVWVIFYMLAPGYLELAGPAFNPRRMILHLYPGGGFHTGLALHHFNHLSEHTTMLATASFTAEYMRTKQPRFKRVVRAVSAAQMLYEGTPRPPRKPLTNASAPLVVCMTSLGSPEEKGADTYVAIAEAYTARYGATAPATFLGVGRIPSSKAVTSLPQMSQAALSALYSSRVDVAFNLERVRGKNGWPLASEAMLQGCVLITTDTNGENAFYRFGEEVTIVADRDVDAAVAAIHALATDRARLHRLSGVIADRAWQAFSFDGPGRQYLDVLADTIAYAGGPVTVPPASSSG